MIQRNAIVDHFPPKRFTLQGECKKTFDFALKEQSGRFKPSDQTNGSQEKTS
jgi:hypothetical protein